MTQTNQSNAAAAAQSDPGRQSTVELIMSRRTALLFALCCLATAFFLFYSVPSIWFRLAGAIASLLAGVMFGISALLPDRSCTGVELFDGGFHHFAGVWGKQTIRYVDIDRIVAVQTGGGDMGEEVLLEVYCGAVKAALREWDYFGTDLHRILFALPGFQQEQYGLAANYQLKGLEHLRFKRFVVFDRQAASGRS